METTNRAKWEKEISQAALFLFLGRQHYFGSSLCLCTNVWSLSFPTNQIFYIISYYWISSLPLKFSTEHVIYSLQLLDKIPVA